jgi:hypothetical protein
VIFFTQQEGESAMDFGLLGSSIFIIGLPFSYYVWMIFSRTNQKSIVEIIGSQSLADLKKYDFYIVLITIALFGLIYDYLPKNIEILLYIPLVLLVVFSIINYILNRLTHNALMLIFEGYENNMENESDNNSELGLYERHPYQLLEVLNDAFFLKSYEEQKYVLFTLKRISAIDANEKLFDLIQKCNKSNPVYSILTEVYQYLSNVRQKLDAVTNPYEFIEQSNDIVIIKALLRTQIERKDKNLTIKLLNDNRVSVKKPACVVAGYFDDINIISTLISHLENPNLSHWAQIALTKIGDKSLKYLEIEFFKRKNNLLFVESCLSLLCKIGGEQADRLLFKTLDESNSNIRKIAAKKIVNFRVKVRVQHRGYFTKLFDDLVLSLLSNSYLLEQLELKNENFKILKNAIDDENKESLHLTRNIISLYYNPVVAELIFSNYGSKSDELHAASNLLIDLFINDNISSRNKMKALFSPKDSLLIETLQEEFPSTNLKPTFNSEEDLIWIILKKEYDQINSWTRACAINILHYTFKEDMPFELASEFLNKNQLLKETAAANIYKNLPEFYTIFLSRLSESEAEQIDYLIRSNLDVANPKQINQDNLLLSDKVFFLNSLPYLNSLSISEIIIFHTYFKPKVLKAGEHQISLKEELNLGYWMIESGSISCSNNGVTYHNYKKRDIFKVSDHETVSENFFIQCDEDVRFLIVEEIVLLNIIKNYNDMIKKYIDIFTNESNREEENHLNQSAA